MHRTRLIIVVMLVISCFDAVMVLTGFSSATAGRLMDGDCYMWLMRVKTLWASGQWYGSVVTETNAPYGEILHWTRPFDLLLLSGAIVGSLFSDFETSLWVWSMAISPLLLLLAVPIWSWGTRPILSGGQFVLSFSLLPLLWRIGLAFTPARPDHHSILGFLFIILLSCMLRLVSTGGNNRVAIVAGITVGLALWISVESLILLVYSITALAVSWIIGWQRSASLVVRFLVAVMVVVIIGVSLQYPSADWLTERYSQIAAPHAWMMLCLVLAWMSMTCLERYCNSWLHRVVACIISSLCVLLALAWVYPTFFAEPWVDYDMQMIKEWLPTISEYSPIFPHDISGLAQFIIEAGPVFLALAGCFVLRQTKQHQRVALVLAVGIAFYMSMSLMAVRWLYYAQILSIVPWTLLIARTWDLAESLPKMSTRIPARLSVIILIILGPLLMGASVLAFSPTTMPIQSQPCNWVTMARYLRKAVPSGSIVMTHTFEGPELAWWGNVRVVGSPYGHNNIADTWRFFRTTDDQIARRITDERGIDYVLICASGKESINLGLKEPGSLYSDLQLDKPPSWLQQVITPVTLSEFKLFHVFR